MMDPLPGSHDDPRSVERRRILAARGWEHDRQRVHALRELLSEPLPHIFLWSYSQLRNRDRAIQNTRDALVWMSRHLGEVPEEHPVDRWIFEHIALESPAQLAVRRSELGPEPALALGDQPNEQYLESYPTSQKYRSAYAEYRAAPQDPALLARSGWALAEADLRHFVEGHFSEEGAGAAARPPLRQRQRYRLRRVPVLQWVQLLLFALAIGWIALLWHENAQLKQQLLSAAVPNAAPRVPALAQVRGHQVTHTTQAWIIGWDAIAGADGYTVSIMTEKMDTLLVRDKLSTARCMIPVNQLIGVTPDGPFLYKIDAYRHGHVIATSGYVAYPPI
ncbi:MAG: hypothetical protein KC729_14735 [Candidatus Eisenbacteria bacterium]|uniref:Uncharacterized protein n=1 Tax=Eiseniibacteriota bacterium TaxID=2212470 RepID=A0A956M2X2_UNCEI|nr:hypothetical protein [Candidatus Eisenbacteria bacterium]